ncbi:MAG: GEVED domain-containing protein [Chitinophagales bacterium]
MKNTLFSIKTALSLLFVVIGMSAFAQTTYYSKAAATDFNATATWGTNTDGSGSAPASISNADNFVIQNASALSLTGTASVGKLTINTGSLTVAANTLNIGYAGAFNSTLNVAGGTFTVSGGAVNVNGNVIIASTFNQSGGTITVDGNNAGGATGSVAAGTDIFAITTSAVTLTAGSIVIVDPNYGSTGASFSYNNGSYVNTANTSTHVFQFGDGSSTDATANTSGFTINTWVGSGRFLFGNFVLNSGSTGNRAALLSSWSFGIARDLTITSGIFNPTTVVYIGRNLTNNGIMQNTSTVNFASFVGGTAGPTNLAQTVSGTGVYRNATTNAASTANFSSLTINNSNASGVTFSDANSLLCVSGGPTNTGTVSGTLTFKAGDVNLSGNTIILGVTVSTVGTLSWTAGGVNNGSFKRFLTTTTLPTTLSSTTPVFPFSKGANRSVFMARSAAWTTAGSITATYNDAAGLNTVSFTDGAYTVNRQSAASWSFSSGNGINVGATTLSLGLSGDGIVILSAAPGTAPRLVQAAGALQTHVAGTGTAASPIANRSAFTLANLTGAAHYIGVNSADLGFYTVTSGKWEVGSTWNTGVAPTASDNPIIMSGHTVTIDGSSGACVAKTVTMNGTSIINVTGSSLTITAPAASGSVLTTAAAAQLNISGGTVNIGTSGATTRFAGLTNNGTLSVSSGTLNVYGFISCTANSTFNQSGGNINIDGNAAGVVANSVPSGTNILNLASQNLNWTGGTLTIIDPHTTSTNYALQYTNSTANVDVSPNHTLVFGDGTSTDAGAANGFYVYLWPGSNRLNFGTVIVNGPTGTNRFVKSNTYTFAVRGDLTINNGGEINTTTNVSVARDFTVNSGGFYTNTSTTLLASYSGTGAAVSTFTQNVGGAGTFRNAASSPTANFAGLTINNNNATGVNLNLPFSTTGTLTMTSGIVNTSSTNLLQLGSVVGTPTAGTFSGTGSATNMIKGPFARVFAASTSLSGSMGGAATTFPVGKSGYNPIYMGPNTTASGPIIITAEAFDGNTGTADGTTLLTLGTSRYWSHSITNPANLTFMAVGAGDASMVSGNALGYSSTASGVYSVMGSGSTFVTGTPNWMYTSITIAKDSLVAHPYIGFGTTGPLNVSTILADHSTAPAMVPNSSTNNNLMRVVISALGSSGTVTLTGVTFNYTGTNASDIAASGMSLWTGTATAPSTQIGSSVSVSGGTVTFTGLTQAISSGNNFIWLRFNTSATAVIDNLVDVTLPSSGLTFSTTGGATATAPLPATTINPAGNVVIGYCLPTYTNSCTSNDIITAFSLNTLSSTPGCGGALPNNFQFIPASTTTTNLEQGVGYTANFTIGSGGAQYVGIWIDFNQNGVYEATEGVVSGSTIAASSSGTLTVTIPGGATLGATHMRVLNRYSTAITTSNACLTGMSYGSCTDYVVTIVAPTPRTIGTMSALQVTGDMTASSTNNNLLRIAIPVSGSLGTQTLNSLKVTYTGASASDIAASGVTLWTGTATAPSTQIGTGQSLSAGSATFSGLTTALAAGTNYLWIRVNTSAGAVFGNIVDAKVNAGDITITAAGGATAPGTQPGSALDPAGTRKIGYCAISGSSSTYYITDFSTTLGVTNISNTGTTYSLGGYGDYTSLSASQQAGNAVNFSVTYNTTGGVGIAIYIDYDHDGVFNSTDEKAFTTTAYNYTTNQTGSFTIPLTALSGNTRMRVVVDYNSTAPSACSLSSGNGEVEDYTFNVIPLPDCSGGTYGSSYTTTSTATAGMCYGPSVSFTMVPGAPALSNQTYKLEYSTTAGGTYSVIAGPQASPNFNYVPSASGYYRVVIYCNGTAVTSTTYVPVNVTVNNPSVASTDGPKNVCGTTDVNLNATPTDLSNTIVWYTKATGGTQVGSGSPFLRTVTKQDTLYVGAQDPTPVASVVGPDSSYTSGSDYGATGSNTEWTSFRVSGSVMIDSILMYPTTAGTIRVVFLDSATGNKIDSSAYVTVTSGMLGHGGVYVPVNKTLTSGAYKAVSTGGTSNLFRNTGSSSFYFASADNSFIINNSWNSPYYYFFYLWHVKTLCQGTRVMYVMNYTAPAAITVGATSTNICQDQSTTLSVSSANTNYTYNWDNSLGAGSSKTASPMANTTYTVTATDATTSPVCYNVKSIGITVREAPDKPVLAGDPTVCIGVGTKLNATNTITPDTLPVARIASNNFDAGLNGWTINNTYIGGTVLSAAYFHHRATPPILGSTAATYSVTNPASGFVIADADSASVSGSALRTTLTSTTINTTGTYAKIGVTWLQYFRFWSAPDSAWVLASPNNGTTWDTLRNYTSTKGSATVPNRDTAYLGAAYFNNANVKIRYEYRTRFGYYWAIDSFEMVGFSNSVGCRTWTSSGSPTYIYTDAGYTTGYTPAACKDTVYVKPPSSQSYYLTNTALNGCSRRDTVNVFVSTSCNVVWNGSVDTNWHNAANWTPPVVPNTCNFDIEIPTGLSRYPTLSSANAQVGNMLMGNASKVTLAGKDLSVCKNWKSPGYNGVTKSYVVGSGKVILNGTTAQDIYGDVKFDELVINNTSGNVKINLPTATNISIYRGLTLKTGNFDLNGSNCTLLSSSTDSVAYINDFGTNTGTLTGNVTVQRYVGGGGTWQHYVSSPVSGTTLVDIGSGAYGSGHNNWLTPASNCSEDSLVWYSDYSSYFQWDESHVPTATSPANCFMVGWKALAETTPMDVARGYSAYLVSGGSFDLKGAANTGNKTIGGLTNSNWSFLTPTSHTFNSGWSIVGNPYPSSIDMTTDRTVDGFDAQVQVYVPSGVYQGTFQAKTTGAGATAKFPAFQGFMVHKTNPGGSATYKFYQNERNTNQGSTYHFNKQNAENSLSIEVDHAGNKDITRIEFNSDATAGFDPQYDANKFHSSPGFATLYTLRNSTSSDWMSVNAFKSISETPSVEMGFEPGVNGQYTMTFDAADLANFDATSYIFLEDRKVGGNWIDVRANHVYTFTTAIGDNWNRFVLHFTPPIEVATTQASCNTSGSIELTQPGTASWTYTLKDAAGTAISNGTINSSNPVTMPVNAGSYTISLVDANGYVASKAVTVGGVQGIVGSFSASAATAHVNDQLNFNNTTTGAVTMEWTFGDGAVATGNTVAHQYANPGVYTVTLKVTNADGCQSTTSQAITVSSVNGVNEVQLTNGINIFSFENRVMVDFTKLKGVDATVQVYNLIGQELSNEHHTTSTTYVKAIDSVEAAYVIVKVKMGDKLVSKKVFIRN